MYLLLNKLKREIDEKMVDLKLNKVLTCCKYNIKDGIYSQHIVSNRIIEGSIDESILIKIIKLNMYILQKLLDNKDDKHSSKNIKSDLHTLFNELLTITHLTDIIILNMSLAQWFDYIWPRLMEAINEKLLDESFSIYARYGDMDLVNGENNSIKVAMEKKDYNAAVNSLLVLNRIVYTNFSLGMVLCSISELYVIFMKLEQNEKDSLVTHIFGSYLQKLIVDDSGYKMSLRNYGNKRNISPTEHVIAKELCNNRQLKDSLPILNIAKKYKNSPYTAEQILKLYDKWDSTRAEIKTGISSCLKIAPNTDIIPFIFTYNSDRITRVKLYAKWFIGNRLGRIPEKYRNILVTFYLHFDQTFDQILFPNRKLYEKIWSDNANNKMFEKNLIVNINRFENGEHSLHNILLKLMIDLNEILCSKNNPPTSRIFH